MASESARATTTAEARYRLDAPNSRSRTTKIIALDAPSEAVVKRLAVLSWNCATFFTASAFAAAPRADLQGWLSDLAGRTKSLIDEVADAEHIVMIATAGENAQAAAIGEACQARHVMTTGLVLGPASISDARLSKTLAQLRPHAMMLVVASTEDYIEDMLRALRT
jgi:phage FluMu protein gp41